jgi:hypothetical protein
MIELRKNTGGMVSSVSEFVPRLNEISWDVIAADSLTETQTRKLIFDAW